MTDFLNRIRHDRDLAARLAAAVGVKDGEAALAALIGFAAQNGFDVTRDDAQTVRDRLQGIRGQEGELADTELESVTGGCLAPQVLGILRGGITTGQASGPASVFPDGVVADIYRV